jgi:hypothetical protein
MKENSTLSDRIKLINSELETTSINSLITSSTTPLDLLEILQNTLIKLEEKLSIIQEKNTIILHQTEQMHKLNDITSKLDKVLGHQQEAKDRWQHWGDKKKHWCKWFNNITKSDANEQWNTSTGDWVNHNQTQDDNNKRNENKNNVYPDVDYNNLFFENENNQNNKEIHSFQTTDDRKTNKSINNESDNIKRSRSELVNKVMDSAYAYKSNQLSENHGCCGLVKKCPQNHKLK